MVYSNIVRCLLVVDGVSLSRVCELLEFAGFDKFIAAKDPDYGKDAYTVLFAAKDKDLGSLINTIQNDDKIEQYTVAFVVK